jgi:aminoglycoside phosphotransferase (APT) family kinase protein
MDEISPDDVASAVEALIPAAAPVRPLARLRKGRSHLSWVLTSAQGRLVGKVATRPPSPAVVSRLEEHQRIAGFGVAVPTLLAFTSVSNQVGGRMVLVARYLPGSDAEEAFPGLPERKVLAELHECGRALARLHQVPVPNFGQIDTGLGEGPASWADYVSGRIERLERAYRDSETEMGSLAAAGLKLLWRLAEDVSVVVSPAIAHLDLYLPNILLDEMGEFRSLLDCEHLRWVDPAMDFVKPGMWVFDDHPEWSDSFIDGYDMEAGHRVQWRERVSVATGLELLTGIEYWARVGADDMRRDYLRRLQDWVRSDGLDRA